MSEAKQWTWTRTNLHHSVYLGECPEDLWNKESYWPKPQGQLIELAQSVVLQSTHQSSPCPSGHHATLWKTINNQNGLLFPQDTYIYICAQLKTMRFSIYLFFLCYLLSVILLSILQHTVIISFMTVQRDQRLGTEVDSLDTRVLTVLLALMPVCLEFTPAVPVLVPWQLCHQHVPTFHPVN